MAEIIQKDGTWSFDGDSVRIVPGSDKGVGVLRQALGELNVPLEAIAGVSYEPGRKSGRLRLRLRGGADPLLQLAGGRLKESWDPYALSVEADRAGVAEYFVDEVRNALLIEQIGTDQVDRYLMPGPSIPVTASAGDGTAEFDGDQIRLSWNWKTEDAKASGGPRTISIGDVEGVDWLPAATLESGYLRFTVARISSSAPAKHDPHAIDLWGFRKDPLMGLVGAAVVARLPHPYAPKASAAPELPPAGTAPAEDHDTLLRRLRELGELHRSGILTDEEFSTAKQAVLKRL
ncbi:DUF4429 domain-containing protein [Streptomyces qinzhouensis]|uniref:DUF4429 domain-containing protein n=1 Tax=Streptomyces qinzhouensis TaxID=2599401 RepID=A0A5B8IHN7_9ACTN|nr:DUF4429 domain-containing protein [Streptomyces qinzhouensis]QDY76859.1 DUF4429 domain-containing protein [Streptomyces qinzhouensis]